MAGNGWLMPLTRGASYQVEDFGGLIRLLDGRQGTGGAGALPGLGVEAPGNEDDRKPVAAPAHPFEQLDPAHFRHMKIENQAIAIATADGGKKLPTGGEFADLKAFAFEQQPKRIPNSVIIVYDENHRPFPARNSSSLSPG